MSNNKELLELAAVASGMHSYLRHENGLVTPQGRLWNPLTDNDDAFRLAVNLNLSFCVEKAYIVIHSFGRPNLVTQQYDGDPYAATRKAIVCAAAEIGKTLLEKAIK